MQRTRQAVLVKSSVKKKNSRPVMMAPKVLAAAISIVSRITDAAIVPRMPVRSRGRTLHIQRTALGADITVSPKSVPIATVANANNAHKKGVATVNIADTVRKPAIMPITMLARTATPVQLGLQLQLFIKSPPIHAYAK